MYDLLLEATSSPIAVAQKGEAICRACFLVPQHFLQIVSLLPHTLFFVIPKPSVLTSVKKGRCT
jgi:hypothetical protein